MLRFPTPKHHSIEQMPPSTFRFHRRSKAATKRRYRPLHHCVIASPTLLPFFPLLCTITSLLHCFVASSSPPLYPFPPLSPCKGICYNLPAVERAAKTPSGPARPVGGLARSHREDSQQQLAPSQGELARRGEPSTRAQQAPSAAPLEDASRYCPVCSQRLESRRCKLVCPVCGYYMSCADYY